jgi:hypothetical protein
MCFVKRDQPLPKNEAAYRLRVNAPVAQLDRVRGYEPLIRFLSLPHGSAISSAPLSYSNRSYKQLRTSNSAVCLVSLGR